jgi:hypothetical protein
MIDRPLRLELNPRPLARTAFRQVIPAPPWRQWSAPINDAMRGGAIPRRTGPARRPLRVPFLTAELQSGRREGLRSMQCPPGRSAPGRYSSRAEYAIARRGEG